MAYPFLALLAGAFIIFLFLVLLLNIFGLPANWLILGLVALWAVLTPYEPGFGFWFWTIMLCLAIAGEIIETGLQVVNSRKHGSSTSGTVLGMIGAFVGAILLSPLFWGLGALIGALAGAWTGCFLMELIKGKKIGESADSAFGAMLGRFLGTICKMGIGAVMIAFTAREIWPEMVDPLPRAPTEVIIAQIGFLAG